tara:strand:+ start:98 stop:2380 length:2283 start_codon:yes stop_codon:yes gene_type:complete
MQNLTENENTQEIMLRFEKTRNEFYLTVERNFNEYKDKPEDKGKLNLLKVKYPHLKRLKKLTKRTDISKCKAFIYELLNHGLITDLFTEDEKRVINEYCIRKIRGLYKHAQAWKTGICNKQIIISFSEKNTISLCVTKNTLEANDQWLIRLFKELNSRFPRVSLREKIMIISSRKNNLEGNATHCKSISEAWMLLSKRNNFRIIFMCSNKMRIQNISEITELFKSLKDDMMKNLRIIHDEAHNSKEGIPPFRDLIENIVAQNNVLSYQPVTASNNTIHLDGDDCNPLWNRENLENNAINFTEFDNTKSTDPRYSSCSDAIPISLTKLSEKESWKDYGITEVSRELFMSVTEEYIGKSEDNLTEEELNDVDRRRKLEFCQFMKFDQEIAAVNNALNILNFNEILGFEYFVKSKPNIHIIQTPRRKVITRLISERALTMEYNPIVLAVYGNQGDKYHLFIRGTPVKCVDKIMGEGEFNEKLDRLFNSLSRDGVNLACPFIIIGNYNPTGESLSFVHVHYGVVRGVAKLISTNAEEDYQTACRGNYMNTKFKEADSNWENPVKYLIGEDMFIENSLSYEMENDARIDYLDSQEYKESVHNIVLPVVNPVNDEDAGGTISIPVKIVIEDINHPSIQELLNIADIKRKNEADKSYFTQLLKICIENEDIDCYIEDKSHRLDLCKMTLKDFRTYTQKEEGPKKGSWKFKNYQEHFEVGTPFMNNKNNHEQGDFEILIPRDRYVLRDDKNHIIEKNSKSIWWIGYKY